jgi:hypothetical protein
MITRRRLFKLTAAGVLGGCIAEPRAKGAPVRMDWEVKHKVPMGFIGQARAPFIGGPMDGESSILGKHVSEYIGVNGDRYLRTWIEYRPIGGPRSGRSCFVWDHMEPLDAAGHLIHAEYPGLIDDMELDYVRIARMR